MNKKSVRIENEKVIVSVNNWNIEFIKGKRLLHVYNDNIGICDNPVVYEVSPDQDLTRIGYDNPYRVPEYMKRLIRKYAYFTVDDYAVYTEGYNSLIAYAVNSDFVLVAGADEPDNARKYKIYYDDDGAVYFRYKGQKIPLNDFIRVNAI